MVTESFPLEETILALKEKLARDPSRANGEKKTEGNGEISTETVLDPSPENEDEVYERARLKPTLTRFKLITSKFFDETSGEYRPRMIYKNGDLADELAQVDAELGLSESDLMSDGEVKEAYKGQSAEEVVESLKLDQLLKPISKPSDIVSIPSISNTYTSNHLDRLANELIHIIEQEQDNVILLSKLMNIFLGDDPNRVLEADMGLPEYDHNLDLDKKQRQQEKEDAEDNNPLLENTQQKSQPIKVMSLNPNADPFFMPPDYQSDPELNLELQDADEIRQLVQIALQRNEEFVRSLSQIRGGFVRATRLRDFVYQWCSEIHEEEMDHQLQKEV